jgi:hypothetical protein
MKTGLTFFLALWHIVFFLPFKKTSMKKLQEIVISGASSFIYDILQKAIETIKGRNVTILEIAQSEITDKHGNLIILITMIFEISNNIH